jgi:hypothetical protein
MNGWQTCLLYFGIAGVFLVICGLLERREKR